jgi:hypothetical protein
LLDGSAEAPRALDPLSGPLLRVVLPAAPLLVSGGALLLEKALVGG